MARKPASPRPGARRGRGATAARPTSTRSKAAGSADTKTDSAATAAAAKASEPQAPATPKAPAPRKAAAKTKTAATPDTASKPKTSTRARKPHATAASDAPVAARAAKAVKQAVAAIPTPPVSARQAAVGAAATTGVIAALGAAFFLWRAAKADQPDYRVVEQDGDFEIREYPALVTAAAEARGPREAALDRGFRSLADYIFARSHDGEKIAMTAPVLSDSDGNGWRTRFIMPAGKARTDLPPPPPGISLTHEPPRRVGAVRFSGRADDATLAAREGALRSWLQLKALPNEAKAVHAYYNSPMMPGPFRRNEILVTLSEG